MINISLCIYIGCIIPIVTIIYIVSIFRPRELTGWDTMSEESKPEKTSIQISPETRDRLYRLKFRRTYDQFLNELCDAYEGGGSGEGNSST